MNIPRQFYGINYISRLFGNFQDSELSELPPLTFHELEDVTPIPLTKKDSSALGLRASAVSHLLHKITKDRRCALDGIAIARGGSLLCSGYKEPYSEQIPHITNSTCKTITAIAIMFAISEGYIKESDTVLSFFPEYETRLTSKYVRSITIEHLLNMTSGTKCTELTTLVETNWVKAYLLTDCATEPGTHFVYNSMNTYMLAAILTRTLGTSVIDYLKPRFFEPLGINNVKWELCPQGIEKGGWGLHLSLEGMIKTGMFLAHNGSFRGVQVLDKKYIKQMKEYSVEQDVDPLCTGYGYQIWHLPNELYMLSGMYGQHVIIDEKHDVIVATNAHNDKMFPDSNLVRYIYEWLQSENTYHPEKTLKEKASYHQFQQEFDAFCKGYQLPKATMPIMSNTIYRNTYKKKKQSERQYLFDLLRTFDDKRLHIDQATIKLFPYMLQGMYQCPPFHVTDISFKVKENYIKLCFYKERTKKEKKEAKERVRLFMEAGFDEYVHQKITLGADEKQLAVKLYAAKDEDEHDVIMLDIVFPDAGFSRLIKFFLLDDRIGIECQEYPDMRAIVDQVIYGEAVLAGNTIDLTDKIPESVRVILEHKVEPRVNAFFTSKS